MGGAGALLQERTRQARSERALTDGKPPNETSGQKKHVTLFHRSRRAQILRTRRCRKASAVTEVKNVFNTIRALGYETVASVAGRPAGTLADRAADTLRDQSAASYRGRHRQNCCLHRRIWVDHAAAGRREGHADRRRSASCCCGKAEAGVYPGDRSE